jgi:hypothetical protein
MRTSIFGETREFYYYIFPRRSFVLWVANHSIPSFFIRYRNARNDIPKTLAAAVLL